MTDPTSSALDFYHRMPTTATETAIRVRRTYDQIAELHEQLRNLRTLCDHEFSDPIWNASNTVTEFCVHCGQRRVSAPRPGFVDPQPLGPSYDLSDLPTEHPPTDAEADLPTHAGGWGDEHIHESPLPPAPDTK